jgi:hypothetical protein
VRYWLARRGSRSHRDDETPTDHTPDRWALLEWDLLGEVALNMQRCAPVAGSAALTHQQQEAMQVWIR